MIKSMIGIEIMTGIAARGRDSKQDKYGDRDRQRERSRSRERNDRRLYHRGFYLQCGHQ